MKGPRTLISLLARLLLTCAGQAGGVTITADRLEGRLRTGTVIAHGSVQVTDGRITLQGARAVLAAQRLTLTAGKVRTSDGALEGERILAILRHGRIWTVSARGAAAFETGKGVLLSDSIELAVEERRLVASGDVRLFTPPDVVAFGSGLLYDVRESRVALEGPVKVHTAQGVVVGTALRGSAGFARLAIRGPVQVDHVEFSAEAREAELWPAESVAVLSGGVRLRYRGQRVRAGRIFVFYRERRVVAENVEHIYIPAEMLER
jgi:lipopolysaccharide export system protein LptA